MFAWFERRIDPYPDLVSPELDAPVGGLCANPCRITAVSGTPFWLARVVGIGPGSR